MTWDVRWAHRKDKPFTVQELDDKIHVDVSKEIIILNDGSYYKGQLKVGTFTPHGIGVRINK